MEVEAVAAMGAVIPVEGEAAMGAVIPAEAAMGAVVAAPVPVGIWLLRAAQVQAATLPDGAHVRVCAIELDLAASLRLILKDQIAARKWVVPDLKRVSSLAAVSHLLQTGINAHIALVVDYPHHPRYLEAFREWSWKLQDTAAEVGKARVTGDGFYTVLKKVCKISRRVIAAGHTGKKSDVWIGTKLTEILERILAVERSTVYLLHRDRD